MQNAMAMKPGVLVIEDETTQRHLLATQVERLGFTVMAAADGQEGLAIWRAHPHIRIVITDLAMPGTDGIGVVRAIRAEEKRHTYLMVLTVSGDKASLLQALSAGTDDFVTKPVVPEELALRLQGALRLLRLDDQSRLVGALAELAAARSGEDATHFQRTRGYCRLLAEDLRVHHPDLGLTSQAVEDLVNASVLHDIGIMSIPDGLLNKRGRLTAKEFEIVREHTVEGGRILHRLHTETGSAYLLLGHELAISHHERWDGSGYPQGLQGTAIPLSGRIMALADTYDALRSRRPYKDLLSAAHAEAIIFAEKGKQFDPLVVESFERLAGEFDRIHTECIGLDELW